MIRILMENFGGKYITYGDRFVLDGLFVGVVSAVFLSLMAFSDVPETRLPLFLLEDFDVLLVFEDLLVFEVLLDSWKSYQKQFDRRKR